MRTRTTLIISILAVSIFLGSSRIGALNTNSSINQINGAVNEITLSTSKGAFLKEKVPIERAQQVGSSRLASMPVGHGLWFFGIGLISLVGLKSRLQLIE